MEKLRRETAILCHESPTPRSGGTPVECPGLSPAPGPAGRLEHGAGAAPSGPAFQEPVEGFRLVPGDERGLRGPERERVLHDPADDGLAAHGQEAFGRVAGVGAHAPALARDWQNDFHLLLILDNLLQNGGCCPKITKMMICIERGKLQPAFTVEGYGGYTSENKLYGFMLQFALECLS